jgi:hypothetical protein
MVGHLTTEAKGVCSFVRHSLELQYFTFLRATLKAGYDRQVGPR